MTLGRDATRAGSHGAGSVLRRLDDFVAGPWVAAGFDAAPAGLRAGLRDRGWSVCRPGSEAGGGVGEQGREGPASTPADGPDHYLVRSDGTEATGKPHSGSGGRRARAGRAVVRPAGRGVVYDVRAPEPAGVRCRAATGWQAAHSPLAGVAMWPASEPSESAGD